MPLISITRLRVRSWRFMPGFMLYALRSSKQATSARGNLKAKVHNDRQRTFWTATSWTDEAAMRAFIGSGPHAPAMRKLLHWCDEASVVHWTQESAECPSWEVAYHRMVKDGRPSKVYHPSSAHEAFVIPAPAATAHRDRSLK
jgi:hypothetical protein